MFGNDYELYIDPMSNNKLNKNLGHIIILFKIKMLN